MSRKYSDNKYDNPEMNARIEEQTLKALESLGVHGLVADSQKQLQAAQDANPSKMSGQTRPQGRANKSNASPRVQAAQMTMEAGGKRQRNALGLDFEIPEELQQLLALEMSK